MSHSMKQLIDSGIAGAFLVPENDTDEIICAKALKALDALLTERDRVLDMNKMQLREIASLRNDLLLTIRANQHAKGTLQILTGYAWQMCGECGRYVPETWALPFCDDGTSNNAACGNCLDKPLEIREELQ